MFGWIKMPDTQSEPHWSHIMLQITQKPMCSGSVLANKGESNFVLLLQDTGTNTKKTVHNLNYYGYLEANQQHLSANYFTETTHRPWFTLHFLLILHIIFLIHHITDAQPLRIINFVLIVRLVHPFQEVFRPFSLRSHLKVGTFVL